MTTDEFQAAYFPSGLTVLLVAWGVVGAFFLWKVARGGPKGCWVALGFWGWWLYMSTRIFFGLFNPDGFDNRAESYHIRAVVAAIQAGKTEIMLKDTTDFEWEAVCWIPISDYMHLHDGDEWEGLREIILEVLGETRFWEISLSISPLESDSFDEWLVFVVPNGTKVLHPRWDRLGHEKRYEDLLGGRYYVNISSMANSPTKWPEACYLPHEAGLFLKPINE